MRTVTAREANQQFSKLLEAAVGGEEVTITRRGVPVARLIPVITDEVLIARERRRRAALEWLRSDALEGGTLDSWTRDELYDRDADRKETPGCG
jgi:prevent-host-death family protein